VKRPVDSITTSTPRSRQGSRAGSVSVDDQRVAGEGDLARERAVDRVVLEQMAHGGAVHEVVDGDDVEVGVLLGDRAHVEATDPAEAVDAYLQCHAVLQIDCTRGVYQSGRVLRAQ
jgi:hypothetical protein